MPECEVIQEIGYQEILYLACQRQGTATDTKRICHARHSLKEIIFGGTHCKHVPQRLLGVFGYGVRSTEQVLHIDRQETDHQFLDFFLVTVVSCLHLTVKLDKFVGGFVPGFA